MPRLQLDTEKLAFGIEQGLDEVGALPQISGLRGFNAKDQREYALRMRICNTVAATTHYYLQQQGLESWLFTTEPDLDPQHAIVVVGSRQGNRPKDTVVDGAYSQFLSYVGLTPECEKSTEERQFPEEKVLVFRQKEREKTVEWLTGIATEFQEHNGHRKKSPKGPLAQASKKAIARSFATIWTPVESWYPSAQRMDFAARVARNIPKGTVIAG